MTNIKIEERHKNNVYRSNFFLKQCVISVDFGKCNAINKGTQMCILEVVVKYCIFVAETNIFKVEHHPNFHAKFKTPILKQ